MGIQKKYHLKDLVDEELIINDNIKIAIEKKIKTINKKLNPWENVVKYYLSPIPATIENELITPSMKLKRSEVMKIFKKDIDEMY